MSQVFRLPDVGEGLTEAEILLWKVSCGDTVAINDVLVEVETAKSVVELSSPYAGVVQELHAQEGQTLEVGAALATISSSEKDSESTGQNSHEAAEDNNAQGSSVQGTLVGSGPKADHIKRRARKRRVADGVKHQSALSTQLQVSDDSVQEDSHERRFSRASLSALTEKASALWEEGLKRLPVSEKEPVAHQPVGSIPRPQMLAKPPVRKAAQDMGVNLADVVPTGNHGQVTKSDLLNYVAHLREKDSTTEQVFPESFWIPQGSGGDRIERIKVRGVRKATAKAMVKSAFTSPHVSIFVDVDATRTMEFVKRLKTSEQFAGVKVTPLLILAKAVIWAAARNPQVNATWTDQEILIKHFMNLGIAAATPRGLMVPNIKDAQELSLKELAVALHELTVRAREGKTQPSEMAQGTMTITNIGALGIDTGTPIINPGEVAIIAFGTIKQKPWVVDGEVIPRWVTTLGGSFDHRVVDGDLSARFMADVAAILEEPALLLE
ncbi:dihydrolipoamide acetyltransferase family protein [Rothia sp. P7181]|uniref:dihydrolipoamide acetyltransferase family protein n=1 Tax=unclassified Rothia (in: high G+C Gram-positive bacteria) TaxID=2689056 RepID=UPI003ABFE565